MPDLGHLVQSFFLHYAGHQRGLSRNTVLAYRDSLKLFFKYCCKALRTTVDRLRLEDLDVDIILAFLDYLEEERGNTARSRNARLAALRVFIRFAATEEPSLMPVCGRICSISSKKERHKIIVALDCEEVRAFLLAVDDPGLLGLRDHALLRFLYNSGARVQEVVDLAISDVRLEVPCQALLHGKGRKERPVPLLGDTVKAISRYLNGRRERGINHERLFLNRCGVPLTRAGIRYIVHKYQRKAANALPRLVTKAVTPHTFRHTTALHLLQSGNDLSVVRDWLGHADISTTHGYVLIDMDMKRRALAASQLPGNTAAGKTTPPRWQRPDVLSWLEEL